MTNTEIKEFINYNSFKERYRKKLDIDSSFYNALIEKIIDSPARYVGIYRASNAKTKLVQNVTQSNEIKFGDFLEEIITDYLDALGYETLCKNIGKNKKRRKLLVDQLFIDPKSNVLYMVEQKVRDDHDSTKKEGQLNNFKDKLQLLSDSFPDQRLVGVMWFIDSALKKNKDYYELEIKAYINDNPNISAYLCYEDEFFSNILEQEDAWREFKSHLQNLCSERGKEVLQIPDFNTSEEILKAINRLTSQKKQKLLSDELVYQKIRQEFFDDPCGNISKIK